MISGILLLSCTASNVYADYPSRNVGDFTPESVLFSVLVLLLAIFTFCTAHYFRAFRRERSRRAAMKLDYEHLRQRNADLVISAKQITGELESANQSLQSRNTALEQDISMARKIQMQLVPSGSPSPLIGFFYKPMESVGGDFYDFVHFYHSRSIGIFLSDVSGHGVPAALVTSLIKGTLHKAGEFHADPAQALYFLNEALFGITGGNFVTAFYAIYNPDTQELVYANAGHNPPYLITQDNIDMLPSIAKGIPLGIMTNEDISSYKPYRNEHLQLSPDSKILFYTDGLTEAIPVDGDPDRYFEFNGLFEAILENRNFSAQLFIAQIFNHLRKFRQSENFEDDVCMICLNVEKPKTKMIHPAKKHENSLSEKHHD